MMVFEQFGKNAIAIMIVDDEQILVVVAHAGWGNKAPSAVRINLPSQFHHCGKAVVGVLSDSQGKGFISIACLSVLSWSVWSFGGVDFDGSGQGAPVIGNNCGGYLQSVSLANLGRWPRCRAVSKVDKVRLKSAAWANMMRLLMEVLPMAAFAEWAGGGWMLSSHNFVVAACCLS